ncbi:phytoene/squalene synthase family protein [Embleya sp. AB8]|uniref:phytoene/squalene synthase family protein n=1 Tax=Embleya sp. AB8 TaxID=3156304 RepID=UPI003C74D58F
MRSWRYCLDAAGVRERTLRADYTAAAVFMRRRETAGWGALRVLAPAHFLPHALVGAAMAYLTDDVCDRGDAAGRRARFEAWATRVRAALDTGTATHPLLRAYLHAAHEYGLPRRWADDYLVGSRAQLDSPEFADEAEYQRYIDTFTWPGAMLSTGMTPHLVSDEEFAATVRAFADGFQRTDLLCDLAEDLAEGRNWLPRADLDRYGVSTADLVAGRDTPAIRALLVETTSRARASLDVGDLLIDQVGPEYRPLTRSVLAISHHRLDNVCALGPAITRRPARDNPVECARLLLGARRPGASERPAAVPAGTSVGG